MTRSTGLPAMTGSMAVAATTCCSAALAATSYSAAQEFDTVSYANHNASVYVDLFNNLVTSHGEGEAEGEHADEGHGHTIETNSLYSIERIIGSNYGDVFFTNDSAYIDGGGGNDRMYGGTEGLSVLLGGDGDDLLVASGRMAAQQAQPSPGWRR